MNIILISFMVVQYMSSYLKLINEYIVYAHFNQFDLKIYLNIFLIISVYPTHLVYSVTV